MKSKTLKILIGLVGVVVLYHGAKWGYGEAAETYFNYRCEKDAGEFIYRTVENVEGLYQMRLRDPRDYFDRMRKGDIPEDPYGHTNIEAQKPWQLFVSNPGIKYKYFETTKGPDLKQHDLYKHLRFAERPIYTGEKFWRYELSDTPYDAGEYLIYREANQVSELKSKYGFTWKGIRNQLDRIFGVWGGEITIKELANNEDLGVKRGFVLVNKFAGKGGICPRDKKDGFFIYDFISKVLKPVTE